MENQVCRACLNESSTVEEVSEDSSKNILLCRGCHQRLVALALRPSEWYNLAREFGPWQFHLHDDFYDEDGTATQPEEPVDSPGDFPAPTLDQVSTAAETLLDYSITQYFIEPPVWEAWSKLETDQVLVTLTQRFELALNTGIRSVILEVAAHTLGSLAENLVRQAWKLDLELPALAQASAACLPRNEAFQLVVDALANLAARERRDQMYALAYFRSSQTLDWIESNVFSPVTEVWGRLAATSGLDWARVEQWLATGRPLSLVALDALVSIINPRTLLARQLQPKLIGEVAPHTVERVLGVYIQLDQAPRITKATHFILSHLDVLCRSFKS